MLARIRCWWRRNQPPEISDDGSGPFARFTGRARTVLVLAQDEAARLGSPALGPEHLLLGLLRERAGIAGRVLADLDVSLPQARRAVAGILGRGSSLRGRAYGLTPAAKRVIELAVDEAHRLKHPYIGTEHLLLGLLGERGGVGGGVLELLGVRWEVVRAAVLRALADRPNT